MTRDGWPTDQSPEEHFERLFGQMEDPAFLVESLTGRILACNRAAALELRCHPEELVGRDLGSEFSAGGFDFRLEGIAARLAAGRRHVSYIRNGGRMGRSSGTKSCSSRIGSARSRSTFR